MSKCVKCGNEILTGDIHWEMGLCNNCYNELYKDHKTHISLDKMWLKLAQDFRDENEKLQDKISDLEAKLVESEKKASKKNDESWDLYLSLKQFYSRLGVEAYADDKIQDVAVKELNRLLNENEELKQQLAITEKALELVANMQSHCPYLATKKEDGNVIFYIDKTDCDNNCSNCIKNHYKQRAKEMLENE